jgi:hypothetical protein
MYLIHKVFILFISLNSVNISGVSINDFSTGKGDNNEDKKAIECVAGFFEWYKSNYREINLHTLIYTDSPANFQVSLPACRAYLQQLKSSGYISDNYVTIWMQYFNSKAEYFITNHQSAGPPEGFDLDFVLHSQEPELVLKNLKMLTYTSRTMNQNTREVIVHTQWDDWKYVVELKKINKKWHIDYISLKEPD